MPHSPSLADRIDALLPQTQCTKCGYDGCRPYAQAIADGEAQINRCPPGAQAGIHALAGLLQREPMPLDESRGQPGPLTVAVIDEAHCIGCTLCIKACPVDAIVGSNKRMHTVLEAQCTGCDLCIAPCPVDCIAMVPANRPWTADDATLARQRHSKRQARLRADAGESTPPDTLAPPFDEAPPVEHADACQPAKNESDMGRPDKNQSAMAANSKTNAVENDAARKRAAIENALARARERRAKPAAGS